MKPNRVLAPLLIIVAASLMITVSPGNAHAHVHAVTPLNDCSVDNAAHSGGRWILNTPAAAENGGPIQPGPIPLNTGNASFGPGGGGSHADPHCP